MAPTPKARLRVAGELCVEAPVLAGEAAVFWEATLLPEAVLCVVVDIGGLVVCPAIEDIDALALAVIVTGKKVISVGPRVFVCMPVCMLTV